MGFITSPLWTRNHKLRASQLVSEGRTRTQRTAHALEHCTFRPPYFKAPGSGDSACGKHSEGTQKYTGHLGEQIQVTDQVSALWHSIEARNEETENFYSYKACKNLRTAEKIVLEGRGHHLGWADE